MRDGGASWSAFWAAFLTVLLSVATTTPGAAQSRTPPRSTPNRPAANVVDAIRRSFERRPPEWRQRAQPCLHYLDEAEAFHNQGEDYFVQASRARNSQEQTRLARLGNDAIRERQRLIGEFWACTRRTTAGDEFHSSDPPRQDPKPPHDPGPPEDPEPPEVPPPSREVPPQQPPIWQLPPGFPFPPAEAQPPRNRNPRTPQPDKWIVVLGDSMSAGTRLQPNERWPKVMEEMIRAGNYRYRYKVLNSSKDGGTAEDARARAKQAIIDGTAIVIVAVGINDAQRHRKPTLIKEDLTAIITVAKQKGAHVALCAYELFTLDESTDYERNFNKIYPELAREQDVLRIPAEWAMQIWLNPRLRLDQVHPNADGARQIAHTIYAGIAPILGPKRSGAASPGRRPSTRR